MVFRRRNPLSLPQKLRATLLPPGGWRRALIYLRHRLTRIPDAPHRIARGVACGIFVSFTPFFGIHLILAAALAWAIRGNILAALIGTAVGNPLTFPFIAVLSLDVGRAIMDTGDGVPFSQIMTAFGQAGDEIIRNFLALFTADVMAWDRLDRFMEGVFLPYLIGGIAPGVAAGLAGYWLCLPALNGYQRLRALRREVRTQENAVPETQPVEAREAEEPPP